MPLIAIFMSRYIDSYTFSELSAQNLQNPSLVSNIAYKY